MKLVSYRFVVALVAVLGIAPGLFVAAEVAAEDKVASQVEKKNTVAPKEKTERGQFVSFTDGTLTIKANSGALLETKLPAKTTTLVWNDNEGLFKPANTTEALSQTKAGVWFYVHVSNENATIRVGSKKSATVGTFVSFKDGRLLILGKNLGESFTKKYGNNVHFNKFRDDVPAYESIDGAEYQLIGTANQALGDVKEGTVLTIHGEGDDNITLLQIGVPKKQ